VPSGRHDTYAVLGTQSIGDLKSFRYNTTVDSNLHNAGSVAKVDKGNPTLVTVSVHPAVQGNLLTNLPIRNLTALYGPLGKSHSSSSTAQHWALFTKTLTTSVPAEGMNRVLKRYEKGKPVR
jgi:hypothetical protein